MSDKFYKDLQWILAQPVDTWQVEGHAIVNDKLNVPLLRDHLASPEVLALVADALNFVIKRRAFEMLAESSKEELTRSQSLCGCPMCDFHVTAKRQRDQTNLEKARLGSELKTP